MEEMEGISNGLLWFTSTEPGWQLLFQAVRFHGCIFPELVGLFDRQVRNIKKETRCDWLHRNVDGNA